MKLKKIISILFVLNLLVIHTWAESPNISFQLTGGIFHYGSTFTIGNESGYQISFQYSVNEEFQGVLPSLEKNPNEEFKIFSTQLGYTKKMKNYIIGLNTGIGYGKGVLRGKFIDRYIYSSSDEVDCIVCTEGDVEEFYEEDKFSDIMWTLNLPLGYQWRHFGLGVQPQVYFHKFNHFATIHLWMAFYL